MLPVNKGASAGGDRKVRLIGRNGCIVTGSTRVEVRPDGDWIPVSTLRDANAASYPLAWSRQTLGHEIGIDCETMGGYGRHTPTESW